MSAAAFPILKTARDLAVERILPVGEDAIRALARKHQLGRILGRTYVFTADWLVIGPMTELTHDCCQRCAAKAS